ncbi:MAG: dihydroneopterin aldolase [Bacteroidales bacterium]|jgi:dihydroneopterin aldolase|nr:dihydroneopterin aldolase [Bacteroidales bacterium]
MKTKENVQTETKNSKIQLSGMEFYSHHGCFKEERQVGACFKVDLVLEYDSTQASISDDVKFAVNYQTVYSDIKEVMKQPVNLLETLCQRILMMLNERYPQIASAEVTVYKMYPALGGKVEAVAVTEKF